MLLGIEERNEEFSISYRDYNNLNEETKEILDKVESVVKYVKNNFLKYRIFHGISTLNSEGLSWLDRTGNGLVHV